jgi:hypothetical protein
VCRLLAEIEKAQENQAKKHQQDNATFKKDDFPTDAK